MSNIYIDILKDIKNLKEVKIHFIEDNNILYFTLEQENKINKYELMFLLKDFLYSKGYPVVSGRSIKGNYIANFIDVKINKVIPNFMADNELDAIINVYKYYKKHL